MMETVPKNGLQWINKNIGIEMAGKEKKKIIQILSIFKEGLEHKLD